MATGTIQACYDAYYAAKAADENFQKELVRQFGRERAGGMRYDSEHHFDAKTLAAKRAKLEADKEWQIAIDILSAENRLRERDGQR